MPSGPPELHEKWCAFGPHEDNGDLNAQTYLKSKGYRLTRQWFWVKPNTEHIPTEEEYSAINYLCWEWDFGGFEEDR